MRLLVCGGRDYANEDRMFGVLDSYAHEHDIEVLIHGGASGADRAAARWASISNVPVMCFPANWKKFGKAAGPLRNHKMIQIGKPDLVIAFPGGRGTASMVMQAKDAGIEVVEVS